jgi:hypothetical protein
MTDKELIEEFIRTKGVTKCPPGNASADEAFIPYNNESTAKPAKRGPKPKPKPAKPPKEPKPKNSGKPELVENVQEEPKEPKERRPKPATVALALEPRRDQIIQDYAELGNLHRLAERWDCSRELLRKLLHKWEAITPQPVYEYPDAEIRSRLANGERVPRVAKALGLRETNLYKWVKRRGISSKGNG